MVNDWTRQNYLKLNNDKTQLVCISPKSSNYLKPSYIKLMGNNIGVSSAAKYLGVWFDENLLMNKQINNVSRQGYIMLKNLWKISSKVSDTNIRIQLLHSCILSKIGFCNAYIIVYLKTNYIS